jgi:tRNA U55 pseudouridine synthase TruB
VGPFRLSEAIPWEEVIGAPRAGLWQRVLAPETALRGWPTITLDPHAARAFVHGQTAEVSLPSRDSRARFLVVKDQSQLFLGVGESVASGYLVKPARLLHADRPRTDVLPA